MHPQDVANNLLDPYNYLAMDEDGQWCVHERPPTLQIDVVYFGGWSAPNSEFDEVPPFFNIKYEGSWEESLFEKQTDKIMGKKKMLKKKWEILDRDIDCTTGRMCIYGGWLVYHFKWQEDDTTGASNSLGVTFVPDPDHEWEIES